MDDLGVDAINDQIPWQLFGEMVSTRKAKMKALLMDQEFMSGLGNIYSDEVLFHAGLPWDRSSDSLTSNEIAPSVACGRRGPAGRDPSPRDDAGRTASGAICTTSPASTRTRCPSTVAKGSRAVVAARRSCGSGRTAVALLLSAMPVGAGDQGRPQLDMTPVCPACRASGQARLVRMRTLWSGDASHMRTVLANHSPSGCGRAGAAAPRSNEPPASAEGGERAEPINVAAAAAAAAMVSPISPPPKCIAVNTSCRPAFRRPEGSAQEAGSLFLRGAAFDTCSSCDEALRYIRELRQDEFDLSSDRATIALAWRRTRRALVIRRVARGVRMDARPRARFRPGRVSAVGILLRVAGGHRPFGSRRDMGPVSLPGSGERCRLSEQQFASFGFSIEVPSAWDVEPSGDERRPSPIPIAPKIVD